MDFIAGIFIELVILLFFGLLTTFIVWKLKKKKTDFGEFFEKYGYMLAWAGFLIIAVTIGLIRTFLN
jgi:uncharacterized Tic20 family protein